ncbi:hypothetical protein ACHAPO_007065 [Fusarium lateritium]
MFSKLLLLGLASFAFGQDDAPTNSSVIDEEMGPAAFMWPPDRVWSGDMDNRAPCGSRAPAGNRTEFPMNPSSNDDFDTLIQEKSIADLNPGHSCVKVPDAPSSVSAGDNATLQIIYRADWDAPHNQTFYACADITFVSKADFDFAIPCFNVTELGDDDKAAGATADPSPTATHLHTSDDDSSDEKEQASGAKKLSGGAIAGIVVGSVAGVALIAGAALFMWRRKEQAKRNSRIARMEDNARKHQLATDGSQPSI